MKLLTIAVCLKNGCTFHESGNTLTVRKGNREICLSGKHLPYVTDMAKYFDTYFSQVEPELFGKWLRADYSRPKLHRLSNGIEFELSSLPEETNALDGYFRWYLPNAGDTVFDIGAYCGVFSHRLSELVGPTGKVVAFEPDPLNYELLNKNIARHALVNVHAVQCAVSDSHGEFKFNNEGSLGSALSQTLDRPSTDGTITVSAITLNEACETFGTPNFVKIDAEGAEIEILSGAVDFLRDKSINFVLDTNHLRNSELTFGRVESLFARCGYEAHSSKEFGFMTTWARPRPSANPGQPAI
jgi:FkbM family methyltransferase